MINKGMMSSCSDEWSTPQWLFDMCEDRWGKMVLDVCASADNAKCRKWYGKEEDGLTKNWRSDVKRECGHMFPGNAWMNPPYGRSIWKWVYKAYEEAQRGVRVVGLLPCRTDTKWWHRWVMGAGEIVFIEGRLKFVGQGTGTAPFPSCIAVWDGTDSRSYAVPHVSTLRLIGGVGGVRDGRRREWSCERWGRVQR